MIAPSARRTAVLAAAVITGATAAASAFGQQMASLDEEGLKAHLRTECPRGGDACEIPAAKKFFDALTEQRLKAAEGHRKAADEHQRATADLNKAAAEDRKATGVLRTASQCLSDLTAALTAKPPRITVAEARTAKTTPTPSDDPCVWRERLAPRLGALTKQ